ncbi:GNAT family N-acetyltransferase [Marimonas arenosa]|uniref:GNAT family N-acetyltransferase n=1 Tax=Marimonas arenosa TaxID=1795305 RepID=A0AAE3WAK8_9RHOB|nr:GNAT family N-acetyltransferase [Marimonas arenosa]MDQ2089426.1 GNAT family N-acetyltransferase [Marimonas arenosa]
MAGAITIRPARFADLDAIIALSRRTHAAHQARNPKDFDEPDGNAWHERALRAAFPRYLPNRRAADTLHLAECDGAFAGYLHFMPFFQGKGRAAQVLFVNVNDIGVTEPYQGRGIGRALLAALQEHLAGEHVPYIMATVWTGNEASQRLFETCGFVVSSRNFRLYPGDAPEGAARPVLRRPKPDRTGLVFVLLAAVFFAFFAVLAWLER